MPNDPIAVPAPSGQQADVAFPEALREREEQLIARRRDDRAVLRRRGEVGVALSGGGIRSATFALGVFQALSRARFLPEIDYLSTVSGGGYFGGFLGGLFVRAKKADRGALEEVETQLHSESAPLRYLRENGRFLAPAGSGDLWLGGAVLLRNWIALQLVLACTGLFAFVAMDVVALSSHAVMTGGPAAGALASAAAQWKDFELWTLGHRVLGQHVWPSPWLVVPVALLALVGLPAGWAYFLVGHGKLGERIASVTASWKPSLRNALLELRKLGPSMVMAVGSMTAGWLSYAGAPLLSALALWSTVATLAMSSVAHTPSSQRSTWFRLCVLSHFVIACCAYLAAYFVAHASAGIPVGFPVAVADWPATVVRCLVFTSVAVLAFAAARIAVGTLFTAATRRMYEELETSADDAGEQGLCQHRVNEQQFAQYNVSAWLKVTLVASGALAMAALVHTAVRSIYANITLDAGAWLGGASTAALAAASFARKLAVKSSARPSGQRPGGARALMFYALGFGALLVLLLVWGTTAELIVYRGDEIVHFQDGPAAQHFDLSEISGSNQLDVKVEVRRTDAPQVALLAHSDAEYLESAFWSMLLLLVLGLALGFARPFLNGSTHLPLYAARLTRAYLGASNSHRMSDAEVAGRHRAAERSAARKSATSVMPGDDIEVAHYFRHPGAAGADPYTRGAPLHLINVTINETVDGRSQIQQADRRGLGMAIGPCGVSAGVRHHAVLRWDARTRCSTTSGGANFPVFDYDDRRAAPRDRHGLQSVAFRGEPLTIGRWLGISGAAFSTGLGYRTNAGLSLLAGLTNIRLGYWWDSGIVRYSVRRALGVFFWVQHYLRRELLARFPGTAYRLWYLSDGGHFENMGGYELIRRRLPWIIVIDAEADADYEFEGLANLVRKARLDFGAEIEFLRHEPSPGHAPIASAIRGGMLRHFGSTDELARGDWEQAEALSMPAGKDQRAALHKLKGRSESGVSLAHASVARVTYIDGSRGWLLYIKPTLTGDEPTDVMRYHAEHPDFPHESTGDQFFDEAQWESYRMLGEHIGAQLFPDEEAWPFIAPRPIVRDAKLAHRRAPSLRPNPAPAAE